MKITALLLVAALLTPAALAFGFSAALVSSIAIGIALSAIALSDYHKANRSYAATIAVKPAEIHPLAA